MTSDQEKILLFDGFCNLCNGVVKFVIKSDKKNKFKFASLQSGSGQTLLKRFDLPANNFESFVLISGDHYFIKSSAVLQVMKELGGFWKLFYFLIILPRPLRDFVYKIIANNRYKIFGKRESCSVPDSDMIHRFLQ